MSSRITNILLILSIALAVSLSDTTTASVTLLLALAARINQTKYVDWLDSLALLMLAWLLWLPLSLFWSMSPGFSLYSLAGLICLPLAWLSGRTLPAEALKRLLHWLPASLLLIVCIWAAYQGPDTFSGKPQGPFNDPNAFAALLNLLLIPLIARWLDESHRSSPLIACIPGLTIGGLYIAFLISSRGATLAFFIATAFLAIKAIKDGVDRKKLAFLIAIIFAAFFSAQITTDSTNVASRLADTITQGDTPRWLLLGSAWTMIMEHPWLGTGLGSFRLLYPRFRSPEEAGTAGGWVHNDYLQLWLEAGLPMLLLMIILVIWVARQAIRSLEKSNSTSIESLGLLLAVASTLMHAAINFLIYFSLIAILTGLYLARFSSTAQFTSTRSNSNFGSSKSSISNNNKSRAWIISSTAYLAIVGFLLVGQVATEALIFPNQWMYRKLTNHGITYPRYTIAYWLSIISPFNPTPHEVMGVELANLAPKSNSSSPLLRESVNRMEKAQSLIPCFTPYSNDALQQLTTHKLNDQLRFSAMNMVNRALECNSRHGLSYWYAGVLAEDSPGGNPLHWWQLGLSKVLNNAEKYTLITAIESKRNTLYSNELRKLANEMANMVLYLEENPNSRANAFWQESVTKLQYWHAKRKQLDQASQLEQKRLPRY